MRTRTKSGLNCPIIPTSEYAWNLAVTPRVRTANYHPYGPNVVDWTVPNGYKLTSETFVDELGTDGSFRDCSHTFESNTFNGDNREHRFPRGWGGNAYLRGFTASLITNVLSLRTPPLVDMAAMADEALAFMMPRLNEGTSLVNFVLELKDLKRMNPTPSIHRLTRRNLPLKSLRDPRTRKDFLSEVSHRMASAHLNASFGIVPLLRDIAKMADDLWYLRFRLKALKNQVGQRLQRHYKRVLPASAGQPATRDWVNSDIGTYPWSPSALRSDCNTFVNTRPSVLAVGRGRWIKRPVYHATLRYSYSLPSMGDRLEKVDAYLDLLGVRLDPAIVWNAIPFSFLIDWVVNVSAFLGTFARDNFPIDITIHDFCHSFSWHKECELEATWLSDPTLSATDYPSDYKVWNTRVFRGVRTSYSRAVFKPTDIPAIKARAPRLREAALAGSLLLANGAARRATRYQDLKRLPNLGTNR